MSGSLCYSCYQLGLDFTKNTLYWSGQSRGMWWSGDCQGWGHGNGDITTDGLEGNVLAACVVQFMGIVTACTQHAHNMHTTCTHKVTHAHTQSATCYTSTQVTMMMMIEQCS